jgi:large subunit ribosomal protein L21
MLVKRARAREADFDLGRRPMFAVVRTGGKQYRVHPGDKIVVEKLDGNAGDKVTLGDVLLAGDGSELKKTEGLTVAAEIVAQAKGEKVTVFKKRRRHNYRRKKGHRQHHTILKIVAIGDHKAEKAAPKAEAALAPAAESSARAAAPAKGKKAEPEVAVQETPNPAPNNEAKANPPVKGDVEQAPKKAAKAKKVTAAGKSAKAASTENAAPAKGAAKKSPKAK